MAGRRDGLTRGRLGVAAALGVAFLLSCGREPAPPPDAAPTAAARRRVAVALGEPIEGLEEKLREAARALDLDLALEKAHGHAAAQVEQVERLLEHGPSALLLGPVVPDVLSRAIAAAARKQVPLVSVLRGDGRLGSWVGVASGTLARAAGERAGRWLAEHGRSPPRVIVLEDPRWPETRRRVEETLRGLEAECGRIELLLRAHQLGTPDETAASLFEAMTRAGSVDVLVAGDRFCTEGAVLGARKSAAKEPPLVVGTTDDPELVDAAKATDSRILLVAWKREELVREVAEGLSSALSAPAAEVKREVACELLGLGVSRPKEGGP